jgi:hypothetical protein
VLPGLVLGRLVIVEGGSEVIRDVLLVDVDEEDELEELETVSDGVPDGWEVEGVGDRSVEVEVVREVGLGVSGVVVGGTTEVEGSGVTVGDGEMTGPEVVEVFWRLCNQCRFSSMS